MRDRRQAALLGVLLLLAAGLLVACGGGDSFPTTCGAQLCIADVRLLRPDDATLTLLFELTETDGSIDEASPPTFAEGLSVALDNASAAASTPDTQASNIAGQLLADRFFAPEQFSCLAGAGIPGAEDRVSAACLLNLNMGNFAAPPAPGDELLLTFYNDTFPVMSITIAMP